MSMSGRQSRRSLQRALCSLPLRNSHISLSVMLAGVSWLLLLRVGLSPHALVCLLQVLERESKWATFNAAARRSTVSIQMSELRCNRRPHLVSWPHFGGLPERYTLAGGVEHSLGCFSATS